MATVTAGTVASIFCPLASTISVTPGAQAVVRVENPNGSDSFEQARIGGEQAFSVAAGETMFIEAVGSDATYTDPNLTAGQVLALQAAPSQDGRSPQRVWVLGDSLEMRQDRKSVV